jgi:hypothetical protein
MSSAPIAAVFLSRLVANDVAKLQVSGKALYAAMLNDAGGVIDDLIIYFLTETPLPHRDQRRHGPQGSGLDAGQGGRMEARRHHHPAPRRPTPLGIIAVQGPNARAKVWEVLPQAKAATEGLKPFFAAEVDQYFIASTGYTGEDGYEIMLPAAEAEALWNKLKAAGVAPCGLGARDTLRLEAGMNLYGQDMDETVSPLDAGLAWTVAMKDERDFVGKSALTANGQQKCSSSASSCSTRACCADINKSLQNKVMEKLPQVVSHQHCSNPSPSPACRSVCRSATKSKSISAASYSRPRSSNPYSPATAKQSSNYPHSGENHVQRPRQPQIRHLPRMGSASKLMAASPSAFPTTPRKPSVTSFSSNCRKSAPILMPKRKSPSLNRSRLPLTFTPRSPAP